MILYSSLILLLSLTLLNVTFASYVTHPNINFDPLEQLTISGSYDGISLYKDTKQLTAVKPSTSSIISLSNDTLQLLGSSNIDGTIYDACIFNNNTLIFGGNFTTINGQSVNNIASIDLTNNEIKQLSEGLDGDVYSIYCDTNDVYVGGSFIAPSTTDSISYSNSLSQFGGNVALWKNDEWVGLPWKGLNGPVYSIIKNKNNQVIFGGSFDTTTDGQTLHAPASQPISLPATGVSATSGSDPSSILCASSSWLLSEGVQGTWQTSFINYNVNPSLVRIANSKVENHQTKEFSIRSLTNSTLNFSLSYLDPVTGISSTCSDNCTLSNDPSVTYQDFRILDTFMTTGIVIDIKSWYGVGGGLSFVQVFQSEIFAYAVNPDPKNICTSNATLPKVVTSGGNWTQSSDTTSPYLSYPVKSTTDTSSVTFYPNIAESGIYEVLIYTPQCATTSCTERTDIDISFSMSTTNTANLTMSQKYPGSMSVYTGYFDLSQTFDPSIKFTLAQNASITSTSELVAFAVQLVKAATNDALSSVLQYNATQTNITMTTLAWGALSDNVPYKSVIQTMEVLSNGDIYLGGKFTGTDKANSQYTNIVQYDSSANQLRALTSGGLDGTVQSITATLTDIYIGGNFTGISNKTATAINGLTYVAQYNIKEETWSPLNSGMNGPVKSINVLSDSVLVSGDFTQLTKSATDIYPKKASGNAWWSSTNNQWIVDSSVPYLSGNVYRSFAYNNIDYFLGDVKSAQRYQSNGISLLTSTDTLNSVPFYPDDSQSSIAVSSGVLFNDNNGVATSTASGNTSSITIFGGVFNLPNNIQNIAIYYNNNNTWSGLEGADWEGQISTMAVNNDLLYVGGRFTGPTSNNLAVFNLSNKSLSLFPNVQTNDGSPANVNVIRHIPAENAMIFGGNFSSIDSLACPSICSLNIASFQWTNLGSGLVGEVYDFILINEKLVTSGNLTLNDSPLTIAEFDFNKNTWGPFDTANLPGPSRAISYDNITNYLYISGQTADTLTTYLRIWDGQQFKAPIVDLGSGSIITKLTMLPVTDTKTNILLATGFINLGELGNVSAAFYDGESWIPYLVTSNDNGDYTSTLSSLFFLDQPYVPAVIKNYLPTPIVILVAIAVALGIVFLIVFGAMLVIFVKRKRDSKVNPQSSPSAYYGKPPRTPQSLLTMLKEASSNDKNVDKEDIDDSGNNSMDKPRHLEPETEQFYNMSKSISTEHLHEQALTPFNSAIAMTTARAAPPLPTTHVRSISSQNNFNNIIPATAAVIGTVGTTIIAAGAMGAARPESYARPISEYQRDTNSFYNNGYTNREMAEVPGRQSPYNPFRNSEIGVAIGNDRTGSVDNGITSSGAFVSANSRHIPSNYAESNRGDGLAYKRMGESISYGNIPPANTSTAAISTAAISTAAISTAAISTAAISTAAISTAAISTAVIGGTAIAALTSNRGQPNNNSSNQQGDKSATYGNVSPYAPPGLSTESPENARQRTSPSQTTGYANGAPISMVGASDESSLLDPISGPQATRAKNAAAENVRWTNTPSSNDAIATAFVTATPTIALHESDDNQYHYQQNYHNPGSSSLSVNKDSGNDLSASNVRWTNNSTSNALGVATIEPGFRESTYHDHGSFYSPTPLNIGSSSNHSLLSTVDTTSEGFSSDPDIARWTTAPLPNIGTAKAEPVPTNNQRPSSSLGRTQYQASLTSVTAWPQDIEYQPGDDNLSHAPETHIDAEIEAANQSYKDDVNTKVIHKNAFRLSDAGSLPPIDTGMFSNHAPAGSNPQEALLSPDSAVRWKTANVGSPIETAHAVNILAPATATVTRRSANEEHNDIQVFEDYYHPKPQQATIVPNPSTSTSSSKSKKYKPVANLNANNKNTVNEKIDKEPVGRKSESIDDVIANRDLNALSMIIQDEVDEKVSPIYNNTPIPTNIRKEAGVAAGPGAMDGRASSKRMVEEYFSSRNNRAPVDDAKDKKSKYKSDFKSIMAAAIQNNTKYPLATEENPHLYYAKFDFSAREHGELGFGKADPIIVVDSSDDIWWMGYKADKSDGSFIQGVFPSNYVEIAVELR